MIIGVGSKRLVKLEAVRLGCEPYFREASVEGHEVESGVSAQPLSLEETLLGATNRANALLQQHPHINLAFGLEAGLVELGGRLADIGVVCVADRNGIRGYGLSQGLFLPERVAALVRDGSELAEAVTAIYGTDSVSDRDCSSVITDGLLSVVRFYEEPTRLACIDYLEQASSK